MKNYKVVTVRKLWTKRHITFLLFASFLAVSAIIAVITFYGQNVGCFTISVSQGAEESSIYISTDSTFSSYSPRLICDSLYQANNISYLVINENYIRQTDGVYVSTDEAYIGYTYYLKNMGDETVNLEALLDINEETQDCEDAVWLWYFEGEDDDEGTIYQKEDDLTDVDSSWSGYDDTYRQTTNFLSDQTVFDRDISSVEPDEVVKFTLILWVEGEDPDCTDSIIGGEINFDMEIEIEGE